MQNLPAKLSLLFQTNSNYNSLNSFPSFFALSILQVQILELQPYRPVSFLPNFRGKFSRIFLTISSLIEAFIRNPSTSQWRKKESHNGAGTGLDKSPRSLVTRPTQFAWPPTICICRGFAIVSLRSSFFLNPSLKRMTRP